MKAIKIIASILLALLVVVAIAVVIGLRNLDALVEAAIESVGTMVTQTDVQVDRVEIDLSEGRGDLYGLTVANLDGFSDRSLFRVDQAGLQILPRSLREDVVVIREIVVDGAELNAEHRELTRINVKELLDNMRPEQTEEPYKSSTASPDVRVMVERLSFRNTRLNLYSDELGERQLSLSDFEAEQLGDRERGLSPVELTRALLAPVLERARERVEQELRSEAEGALRDALEDELSEGEADAVERVRSLFDR